jgi:hypothetical protein
MNPRTIDYLRTLVPEEASDAMPAKDTRRVLVLFDAVAQSGTLADLQTRIQTVADHVVKRVKGAELQVTLAFDLAAAMPVYAPPPVRTLSGEAKCLRAKLLNARQCELATKNELDALDMLSACTCPLLQWQWMDHVSQTLRLPKGVKSMEMDYCPDGLEPRPYKLSLEKNIIPMVTKIVGKDDGGRLAQLLAHHVVAQQFVHGCGRRTVPYTPQGTQNGIRWDDLRKRQFPRQVVGEGFSRLVQQAVAYADPFFTKNKREDRRGHISVLASSRGGALVYALAALLQRYKEERNPLEVQQSFFLDPDTGELFDLGALYNAILAHHQGSVVGFAQFLVAAVVTAKHSRALLEALVASKEYFLFSTDDPCGAELPDPAAATRWYLSAYVDTLEPGKWERQAEAHACDASNLSALAYRRGIVDLPRFSTVGALVVGAHQLLFARTRETRALARLRGLHLLTLLKYGGGDQRFVFDLSQALSISCLAPATCECCS